MRCGPGGIQCLSSSQQGRQGRRRGTVTLLQRNSLFGSCFSLSPQAQHRCFGFYFLSCCHCCAAPSTGERCCSSRRLPGKPLGCHSRLWERLLSVTRLTACLFLGTVTQEMCTTSPHIWTGTREICSYTKIIPLNGFGHEQMGQAP